jgi:hypothetical protein
LSIHLKFKEKTYHFERPHPANPDLDLTINTLNIVKVHTLPPAAASGLSPEQQEFLGHADSIVVRKITTDVGTKLGQSQTADHRLVRLWGAVAPVILAIKTTG